MRPKLALPMFASLVLAFALASVGIAADDTRRRGLKHRYGKELEAGVRELFADPAAGSLPLVDLAEIHAAIASGSQPAELRTLARDKLREALTAPDLEKRRTLDEGIALWSVVRQGAYSREWRPMAARCVHRLARTLDDAALRDAFLAASPAKAQAIDLTGAGRARRQVLFWLLSDRWIEREIAALARDAGPEHRCPPFAGRSRRNSRAR